MDERPYAHVKTSERFELGWNRLQTSIEVLVAAIVVAGLLGLLGTGPLSAAKASVPGTGISVEYERILRNTVKSDMTIAFAQPTPQDRLKIELPSSFLREMDIVSTSPRASAMHTTADGVAYVFDVGDPRRGEITFSMKPKGFGVFTSRLVVGSAPIALDQIVFP